MKNDKTLLEKIDTSNDIIENKFNSNRRMDLFPETDLVFTLPMTIILILQLFPTTCFQTIRKILSKKAMYF